MIRFISIFEIFPFEIFRMNSSSKLVRLIIQKKKIDIFISFKEIFF